MKLQKRGLYLKETDELISILSGSGFRKTSFATNHLGFIYELILINNYKILALMVRFIKILLFIQKIVVESEVEDEK